MKGIVLCGGQSLRMGKDKGLLIGSKKITWAQQAFSLLSKLDIEVALSINKTQYPVYKRVFISHQLVPDSRDLTIKGPLLGILTAHQEFPKDDLIVLACDMIEMTMEILQRLQQAYEQQPGYDAYIFKTTQIVEPLCAIYTAKGLKKMADKIKKAGLEKCSLMTVLDQINVHALTTEPEWKKAFCNMNTLSDLQAVR